MRGARAFFGLVNEITKSLAGPKEFVHWTVQVKHGSNLIGVVPSRFTIPHAVLDTIYARVHEGIESLENSSNEPEGLPDAAMRHVRDLGAIVGVDDKDDTKIWVWTKKLPIPITHRSVAHVAVLLSEEYEDYGTIEGRVQVISDQSGLHVFVTEQIKNRRIRCLFGEELLPKFLAAFRKRVEVKGRIKYRRDHIPISIEATALTEFPDNKDLPSFRQMRGIFRERA